MYLTRRSNGYRFQRRIPKDLVPVLGSSPIRLHLGMMPARQAASMARLLVGHLDRLFRDAVKTKGKNMQDGNDPRDLIIAELRAYIKDLKDEAQQIADVTDQVMEQQEELHAIELEEQANRLRVEALERDNAFKREVNAVYTSTIETQKMVLATLDRAKSERANGTNDVLPLLEALSSKIADLGKSVELVLDGGHPGPLLSAALEEWTKLRGGLGIDGKKVDTDYTRKFLTGTQPILALRSLAGALEVWEGVDMAALRSKSLALTDLFIQLVEARCGGYGLTLETPRNGACRGSQVSFRHENAFEIIRALIERGVIGDFRAPDTMRFGFTPLYLRYRDIWTAVDALVDILRSGAWREQRFALRPAVT